MIVFVATVVVCGIVWLVCVGLGLIYAAYVQRIEAWLVTAGSALLSLFVLTGLSASQFSIGSRGIVLDWSWDQHQSGTSSLTGFLGSLACLLAGCIYLDKYLDRRVEARRVTQHD